MVSHQSPELFNFLQEHRSEKGETYTHTSLGKPLGSYNIPVEKKDRLVELLYNTIFRQKVPVHLTEKQEQHTIIKIDLDFKFELEQLERKYNIEHIKGIVELYHRAIKTYLDVPDEQIKAFVFERDAPYEDRGNRKDGVHLMYPYIVCDTDIQHLIREYVLQYCQPIMTQIKCKNNLNDIVDKSVVSVNNWLMYGCSKPVAKPYKLTHIFDYEYNDLNLKKYDEKTLISLLSIRDHDISKSLSIKSEHKYLLDKKKPAVKPKKIIKVTKLTPGSGNYIHGDINLEEVRGLVKVLGSDRAENYKSWIDIGLCLHNIDVSLLDSWIDFSRKSPKFKEGECEEQWSMMVSCDDGLGMGSLHRWARMDNNNEYTLVIRSNITQDILKSLTQTTQDIAKVVYDMYRYQYVCVSTKQHSYWYEFRNHRWNAIESGVTLKQKLGNEVVREYSRLMFYYNEIACDHQDELKDQYLMKSQKLTDVTYKLRDIGFKEKIFKECQLMFYNCQFINNLDANPDLIGFENGVYDLKTGEFRDGRPEDFTSLSTGTDYQEFNEEDDQVVEIFSFMSQVFPDPEVRDYAFTLLASFLEGRNPNEKFHIWTGVGGNGKSKLLDLFEAAFGHYTSKIPVSLLTQRRSSSNAANPEIARLKGIRTVSTQEPDQSEPFNTGIMKDWTGNDRLTCRALYGEQFDFKPQFKMVFCCNTLPKVPPDDGGAWRRISVMEFRSRFVDNPDPNNPNEFKKDSYIADKLFACREAFMYILLEHYKIYKKQGLHEPIAVKNATRDYQMTNDMYSDFVADSFEKVNDENECANLDKAYLLFKDWWKDNNSGKTPNKKEMKGCLEKKIGKYIQRKGWVGYRLILPNSIMEGDEGETNSSEKIISSGSLL